MARIPLISSPGGPCPWPREPGWARCAPRRPSARPVIKTFQISLENYPDNCPYLHKFSTLQGPLNVPDVQRGRLILGGFSFLYLKLFLLLNVFTWLCSSWRDLKLQLHNIVILSIERFGSDRDPTPPSPGHRRGCWCEGYCWGRTEKHNQNCLDR